jgi:acetyl-CoA carboxylase biotin carboxyl carrier protein
VKTVDITAPTAGSVLDVLVEVGQAVSQHQELVVIESMKMEIPVESTASGRIAEVLIKKANPVDNGDVLMRIETD